MAHSSVKDHLELEKQKGPLKVKTEVIQEGDGKRDANIVMISLEREKEVVEDGRRQQR